MTSNPSAGPRPADRPRRLPDLNALELLVTVAETGSLGRAAARLGISQPAASERMNLLERRLGLQLVHRSTTGSRLTDTGVVVNDWARQVLEAAQALAEGVDALVSRQDGRLQIAASLTLAEHLLPGWLVTLRTLSPGVHVGLQVANSQQVIEAVRRQDADLGFIESPATPRDLRTAVVAHDRLVVVTAPGHPWTRRKQPLTGAELASTPLVLREAGSGTRDTLQRALRAWNGPCEPVLELGSTTPLRAAAAGGAAPAVLSQLAVADDLAARRLVEIPTTDDLALQRTLRAVWRKDTELTDPAQHLLRITRRS
ncbi:DNA-binding transcriptional LysR family regulator [Kitasatospora sp. MAA4]|uniref:LysR substrate-binding domain-containing protein n=1 Tax=Kitasatospora sp. MAA4 TaxID=3035093 RepID=UPI00247621BB|nr:LysR substrate-binding domain-containing protein [Kitasatospora sp. MAA4]MDH6135549.1 DNA-binding transcriptional LysR family regulator [Kitasatospora sp. MAA4]